MDLGEILDKDIVRANHSSI